MTADQFMLWRFRTTEGILAGIKSWNLTECVFENGSKITYDNSTETVTVENHNGLINKTETMKFCELTKMKLFSMGFKERTVNRHSSSFHNGTYAFQFPVNK